MESCRRVSRAAQKLSFELAERRETDPFYVFFHEFQYVCGDLFAQFSLLDLSSSKNINAARVFQRSKLCIPLRLIV